MRKILGALLSLMLMAALFCVPSFAADPVTPEQDVVRVTLPTAITVTDNRDGTFTTPDTTITNNGKADVKVSGITVEPSSGWTLVDWDSLADYTATGEQFISALFYGAAVDASGAAAGESLPAIASGESTTLDCDFWLSPQVDPLNQQVATAVVTIALDGNGGLAYITVDTPPDTVDYLPGDDFDPTGMEVTAHYYDGSTADVTDYVAVEDGTDLVLGQDTVTVTYTEDDTTVEAAVDITVSDPAVYAILYTDGELVFQEGPTPEEGRKVVAVYDGIETRDGNGTANAPWYSNRHSINTVTFATDVAPVNTSYWFYDCRNLTSVNGESLLDTSNVDTMQLMFYNCSSLVSLDASLWDTSSVTNMVGVFNNCVNLTSPNVSSWSTGRVITMSSMFSGCSGLTSLDLSDWDTSNVTNMYNMFSGCSGLTDLDVSEWNTGNVIDVSRMFYNCSGLTSLDISNWNTSSVTTMQRLFYGCSGLTSLDLSGWNTGNVTNMSFMFRNCSGLNNLDISGFDTERVTTMQQMFRGCSSVTTLNLSSFSTPNVTDMANMFYGCSAITTIYATDNFVTTSVTDDMAMFGQCFQLVGGNGTPYAGTSHVSDYACIDRPGQPGYFTGVITGWGTIGLSSISIEFPDVLVIGKNELTVTSSRPVTVGLATNAGGEPVVYSVGTATHISGDTYLITLTVPNDAPDGSLLSIYYDYTGNVNGATDDIDMWDYEYGIRRYLDGEASSWTADKMLTADVNYDGVVDETDATIIYNAWQYGWEGYIFWNTGETATVTVANMTNGQAVYEAPTVGWQVEGSDPAPAAISLMSVPAPSEPTRLFTVMCGQPCAVGIVRNGMLVEEVIASRVDDYTYTYDPAVKSGDELAIVLVGDVNGDGVVDANDGTLIEQYAAGEAELTPYGELAADIDHDGDIDVDDALCITCIGDGYELSWNTGVVNPAVAPESIEVNILDETEGAAVVTAPEEGWVTGENTFTVTCAEPVAVYFVPADGEAVELMGETIDETTTLYTVTLAEGDSIRVTLAEAEPAHVPIEVNILDETEGAAVVTVPEAGWVAGENTFTVSSTEPVAVYLVSVDGEAVELMGETLDETTTLYMVELAEGDSIRVALAGAEPVPETIEVNVLDETEGAAVLTGPEEGWVTGENTFTVSGVEAVSVYHVAADTTVTELTGEAVDDTTTRYTVMLAEGDSIRMELAATEPELPEEQLPVEETPAEEAPVEEAPGDPENQTPEAGMEPSDPVSGAPAEEEPPVEEAPPVEEETPEEETPVEEPEAEDTDTVPEPEAPVEEPETEDADTVTESGAPETSDESTPDTSVEAGEGSQTSEPSPAGEENTVEDVQAGGAESEPAMLPDDETYEAGALAA